MLSQLPAVYVNCNTFSARTDQLLCTVILDPHCKTYKGAKASLYWPCRYRFTRFTTPARNVQSLGPQYCSIEVVAFNQISPSGKYFVSAAEVAVGVSADPVGGFSAHAELLKLDLERVHILQ